MWAYRCIIQNRNPEFRNSRLIWHVIIACRMDIVEVLGFVFRWMFWVEHLFKPTMPPIGGTAISCHTLSITQSGRSQVSQMALSFHLATPLMTFRIISSSWTSKWLIHFMSGLTAVSLNQTFWGLTRLRRINRSALENRLIIGKVSFSRTIDRQEV